MKEEEEHKSLDSVIRVLLEREEGPSDSVIRTLLMERKMYKMAVNAIK